MKHKLTHFFLILGLVCTHAVAEAQQSTPLQIPEELPILKSAYVTKLFRASSGDLYALTEGDGLFVLNAEGIASKSWTKLEPNIEGLDEEILNYYGVAELPEAGLLFFGTDNKGVICYNGTEWKQYNRENAISGDRIFDIQVSPTTRDVVIATDGGLAIYKSASKTWQMIDRSTGLYDNLIASIAFKKDGTLMVAYACGGIGESSPKDSYATWTNTQTKWYWDKRQRVRQPFDAYGDGFPSNLCNTLLIDSKGRQWLGTNSGLGFSFGDGQWKFVRGQEYQAKNEGLFGGVPAGISPKKLAANRLMPEDYITCLTETPKGLWVGTRKEGAALYDPATLKLKEKRTGDEKYPFICKWITSILCLPDGRVYASTYGDGLAKLNDVTGKWMPEKTQTGIKSGEFPALATIPTREQLIALVDQLPTAIPLQSPADPKIPINQGIYWNDDWTTRGNWCGRYGRNYALLLGINGAAGNEQYLVAPTREELKARRIIQFEEFLGPHQKTNGAIPQNALGLTFGCEQYEINSLYVPSLGRRAEFCSSDIWNEEVRREFDGPDLWYAIQLPKGLHSLSLYFSVIQEGEQGRVTRDLDYLIEVRNVSNSPFESRAPTKMAQFVADIKEIGMSILAKPVLCRSRVNNFGGSGVYKNFILLGDQVYYFRISKNYSQTTRLNGVFSTQFEDENTRRPAFYGNPDFGSRPNEIYMMAEDELKSDAALYQVWQHAQDMQTINITPKSVDKATSLQLKVYRQMINPAAPNSKIVAALRWSLNMWKSEDLTAFDQKMGKAWEIQKKVKIVPVK